MMKIVKLISSLSEGQKQSTDFVYFGYCAIYSKCSQWIIDKLYDFLALLIFRV